MLIAEISDIHFRTTNPEKRIDNYEETMFGKFRFILEYCDKNNIGYLLLGGDIFDSPRQSIGFTTKVIALLKQYKVHVLAVFGNHDLYFRNQSLDNTPLHLLKEAGIMTILGDESYVVDNIHFYGTSWDDKIPDIVDKKAFNILVIHIMVIKDKKVYEQQEDYTTAGSLLKNHNFDLIVTGDNHETFTELYKGRRLVNSGSMMRSTVAQKDHEPCFFVTNTDGNTLDKIPIPILPAHEVFLIGEHEETKSLNKNLNLYKEALKQELNTEFDFEENLRKKLKMVEVNDNVGRIIGEMING